MYSCGTYKLYRAFIVNLKVVVVTGFETKEHIYAVAELFTSRSEMLESPRFLLYHPTERAV